MSKKGFSPVTYLSDKIRHFSSIVWILSIYIWIHFGYISDIYLDRSVNTVDEFPLSGSSHSVGSRKKLSIPFGKLSLGGVRVDGSGCDNQKLLICNPFQCQGLNRSKLSSAVSANETARAKARAHKKETSTSVATTQVLQGRLENEASTGLRPWYPSFFSAKSAEAPSFALRASEGPPLAFIHGLTVVVFCEGG